MYLHGLGQDDGFYADDPTLIDNSVYTPIPVASDTGPTSSWDWTGLIKSALTTYGNVQTAKTAQAKSTAHSLAPTARPVYSPFPGALSGGGGALLLGGAGLLAWLIFRK